MKFKKEYLSFMILIVIFPSALANLNTYTFTNNYTITSDDWTFNLTDRGRFSMNMVVLSYNTYHVVDGNDYINLISIMDIAVGNQYVIDNLDRISSNLTITWGNRYAEFTYYGSDSETFFNSITNLHCIARNEETYNSIITIKENETYYFDGYLVDVTGINTVLNMTLSWETDTTIGNEDCEIIVLEQMIEGGYYQDYTTLMVAAVVLIAVAGGLILLNFYFMKNYKKDSKNFNRVSRT